MDSNKLKAMLGKPLKIATFDIPAKFKTGKILLGGHKKIFEEERNDFGYYIVTIFIKEDDIIISAKDILNNQKFDIPFTYLEDDIIEEFIDIIDAEKCDEEFVEFLINNGYKEVLKSKVLKK